MAGTVMLVMVLTVVVAFLLPLLGRRARARRDAAASVTTGLASAEPPEAN